MPKDTVAIHGSYANYGSYGAMVKLDFGVLNNNQNSFEGMCNALAGEGTHLRINRFRGNLDIMELNTEYQLDADWNDWFLYLLLAPAQVSGQLAAASYSLNSVLNNAISASGWGAVKLGEHHPYQYIFGVSAGPVNRWVRASRLNFAFQRSPKLAPGLLETTENFTAGSTVLSQLVLVCPAPPTIGDSHTVAVNGWMELEWSESTLRAIDRMQQG
jgi:hypothetical protein